MEATGGHRRRTPSRRLLARLVTVLCLVAGAIVLESPVQAAPTKVEAESLSHAGGCWEVLSFGALSGGAARTCHAAGAALSWRVATGQGQVVRLYGYRDDVARGFRVRIDDGVWNEGVLSGPLSYSAMFFASPSLSQGEHVITLEWAPSAGGFTFDFYDVEGDTAPAPTTSTTQGPGQATVGRTEAESLTHAGSCWGLLWVGPLSGGGGRSCYAAGDPLTWTVQAIGSEVVRLHGYRDEVARGFRVRIDGGQWNEGTLSGGVDYSAVFFTSPPLAAGAHTFQLEWASSSGAFTFDHFEVAGTTTTPTSSPAPSTTTTIAPVPVGSVCRVSPPDGEAAIAAAIRSCPDGSTVQFPAGAVYHQSDHIEVADRRDLTIDGGGSTFLSSSPNVQGVRPNWRIVRGRNVTLRNMVVGGNFRLSGPRDVRTVSNIAPNQWNSGFLVLGGDGVTIADVTVRDVFGDLVTVVPSDWGPEGVSPEKRPTTEIPRNVRIQRLDGTKAARQCVTVTAAIGLWVEDSTLRDCWYGGVDLERDAPGDLQRDIHILRNTFQGFNLFAIAVVVPGNDADTNGVEIRGNRTLTPGDTCMPTILVGHPPTSGSRYWNVTIDDNELKTLHEGVVVDHVYGGSIRNNRIERTAPASLCAPPAGVPVRVANSEVVVWNNTTVGYG